MNGHSVNGGDSSGSTSNRIKLGAGDDLQIYHDGSNSFIKEDGTGNLYIFSANLRIENADGSKSYIEANDGGATELYYNGSKKLSTDSNGVKINSSSLYIDSDNEFVAIGAGDDLKLYHDGSRNLVVNNNCDLFIAVTSGGETSAVFRTNGGVELYYDNGKRCETTNTSFEVAAGYDFRIANSSTWAGNAYGKIQHHVNGLYISGGSDTNESIKFRYNNQDTVYVKSNGTIYPLINGGPDLGTSSKRWGNIYTSDLSLSNEAIGGNDIDGTWGDWTIQEGESDLFLKNNRSGKKYKFNLTEVS